jgi:hypothetical protein
MLVLLLLAAASRRSMPVSAASWVDVHVSPRGPHTSLASARDFLRTLGRRSATRGGASRTVHVHAGRYELGSPLLLDQRDAHTTWRAYPDGAAPVHSGGRQLSETWAQPSSPGAPWRVSLAAPMSSVRFKQLWVGGERAVRAREPELGSFYRFLGLLPKIRMHSHRTTGPRSDLRPD